MAFNFPSSPAENQEYTATGGLTYIFKSPRWIVKPTSISAGTGDVVGPASAVSTNIAVYSGTTGKLIADGAAAISSLATTAALTSGLAGKQPLDSDLTAIAALAPANDTLIQRKAAAWVASTPATVKTDLALTKSDVGLGSVDNTSDTAKPVSTAQQTALDLKANLASPAFTGNPTAPTATAGDNDTSIATTAFVATAVAGGGGTPTSRVLTAGAGLTGGGDLSADRSFAVGAGTGITVNADDVALTVPVSVANGGNGTTTGISSAAQTALNLKADTTALASYQPLDSDLTAIAALAPANDTVIQRKAGVWVASTPATVKTDLALTKSDVGLSNVDNTSDTAKPVSTAQQTALDAKQATLASGTVTNQHMIWSGSAWVAGAGLVDSATAERVTVADATLTIGRSGGAYTVQNRATDQSTVVSGGSAAANGGNVFLFGESHGSTPGRGNLRTGSTAMLRWDPTLNLDSLVPHGFASYTNAGKPAASSSTAKQIFVSDYLGGVMVISDGTDWVVAVETMMIAVSDETTAITTGTAKVTKRMPYKGKHTKIPRAEVNTVSSSGLPTFDIKLAGTTILGANKLTIDASEKTSATAATATTLATAAFADDDEYTFDITVAGTGAKGAKITMFLKHIL